MRRMNEFLPVLTLLFVARLSGPPLSAQGTNEREVLTGTRLANAFDMGVNSSENRADWLSQDADAMKIAYPSGQAWGAVFVTVGKPTPPPRSSIDLSGFATLLVEVRGDSGTTIEIGIKDSSQPDDGNEQKVIVPVFSNYRTYAIPLTKFNRADLQKIYVVTEFVFSGPQAQNVWLRRIKYTSAAAPSIDAVVDGASFADGVGSGTWTSIFGHNLSETTRGWGDQDFLENKLPKALESVSVDLNARNMAVAFVSPTQVNALVLHDVSPGQSYFSVTNLLGTSVPLRVVVQPTFPVFFTFAPEENKYVAAVHLDGTLVGKPNLFGSNVITRSAKPDDIVQVFGTGFGSTIPVSVADELVSTPLPLADLSQVSIRLGDTPAVVTWGGLVLSGLYQFNVTIPSVEDGDHQLNVSLGVQRARQTVYLSVQR